MPILEVLRAIRRLATTRAYSLTVVLTLALGLGATTAMFGVVNHVLLRPLPYPEPGRLVSVGHHATRAELTRTGISLGLAEYYGARSRDIERLAVYLERQSTLTDSDRPERARIALTTDALFAVLRPRMALGRGLVPADIASGAPGVLVISHELWSRRYAEDPAILGRTVEVDRNAYTVVGVAAPGFHFPHADTDAWLAWGWPPAAAARASLRALAYGAVARLRAPATVADADRELNSLLRRLPETFSDVAPTQVEEMGFRARVLDLKAAATQDVRLTLIMLFSSACLLLVLTLANASNITIVRGAGLRGEVAVCSALGASTWRVAQRFLSEAVVLAASGGGLAAAIALAILRQAGALELEALPALRDVPFDVPTVIVLVLLTAGSGAVLMASGFVAATRSAASVAAIGTSGRLAGSRAEQSVRQALVVCQIAVALALLIGSALVTRSFARLGEVPLGFQPAGLFTFRVPIPPGEYSSYHKSARVHSEILTQLRGQPGIQEAEAGHVSTFPLTPTPAYYQFRLVADGTDSIGHGVQWGKLGFATPGYFETMRIKVVDGRTFLTEDTRGDAPGIVLSVALARLLFGDGAVIGKRVRWAAGGPYPPYTVVGVVDDVTGEYLENGPSRAFYFPNIYPPVASVITGAVHDYIPFDEQYVIRTSLPLPSLLAVVRSALTKVDPKLTVVQPSSLDARVSAARSKTRLILGLLLAGGAAALIVSLVGIYGMLAYAVRLRHKELSVRLALGASHADITRMLVRASVRHALLGIGAGIVAAVALSRLLRNVLFGVAPTDPVAFLATSALLLAVATAASLAAARRVGRVSPASALKG